MADTSDRFALPWLQPGQAQKELFHNEALATLDMALHAAVESIGDNTPPVAPDHGKCWIVGGAPVGDWVGHAHTLAGWTQGGWRFVTPPAGMTVWRVSDGLEARWTGGAWIVGMIDATSIRVEGRQVLGPRSAPIASPAGGGVVDAQARAAITALLAALAEHGLIAT